MRWSWASAAPCWEMSLQKWMEELQLALLNILCYLGFYCSLKEFFFSSKRLFVWFWPMRACDTCLKLLTECPAKINCLGDADHYLEVKTSINITGLIVPVTDSAGCFVLQLNSSDTAFVYICCPPRRDHLRSRAPAGSLWTQAVLPPRPWQESLCCCL